MKAKVLMLFALLVLAASVAMANGGSESAAASDGGDKPVTLVYAEVNSLETIVGKTGLKFKEEVEKLSGGTATVFSFPANKLSVRST